MKHLPLLMLALIASCTTDDLLLEAEGNTSFEKSIRVQVDDFVTTDGTRTSYISEDYGYRFAWTLGDTLGVFPDAGYQSAFPIDNGYGTNTAVFDGWKWALRPEVSYAAYYPFDKMNFDKTKIPVDYTNQLQSGNGSTSHLGAYDYMASVFSEVSAEGNVNFTMQHLGCLLSLELHSLPKGEYTTLEITSLGEEFVTKGTIGLSSSEATIQPTQTNSSLFLDLDNVEITDEEDVLKACLLMAPTTGDTFYLTVTAKTGARYVSSISAEDMTSGHAYRYRSDLELGLRNNGHEFVDLGLVDSEGNPVYWATCNLGAEAPEECGQYFAWGETQGFVKEDKRDFSWATYTLCEGDSNHLLKYVTDSRHGTIDNKTELELIDDAAHQYWKGDWRMPTIEEYQLLLDNCVLSWTKLNNVTGCKFTSKVNDNWIFLPITGQYVNYSNSTSSTTGHYWTSTRVSSTDSWAKAIYLTSSSRSWSESTRYFGMCIRPVCQGSLHPIP